MSLSAKELLRKGYPCVLISSREDGSALLRWYDGEGKRHRHWFSKETFDSKFSSVKVT